MSIAQDDPSTRPSHTQLTGVISREPDYQHARNGQLVATFTMQTVHKVVDRDNEVRSHYEDHFIIAGEPLSTQLRAQGLREGENLHVDADLHVRPSSIENGASHSLVLKDFHRVSKLEPGRNEVQLWGIVRAVHILPDTHGLATVGHGHGREPVVMTLAVPRRDREGALTRYHDVHKVIFNREAANAAALSIQRGDVISLKGSVARTPIEPDADVTGTLNYVQAMSFRVHNRKNTIAQQPPVKEASPTDHQRGAHMSIAQDDPSVRPSQTQLTGTLVREPYFGRSSAGDAFVRLTMETTQTYTDRNNQVRQRTEEHNLVAFEPQAAQLLVQGLRKGDHLDIDGDLRVRSRKTDDGQSIRSTEIIVQGFQRVHELERGRNETQLYGVVREAPKLLNVNGLSILPLSVAVPVRNREGALTGTSDWHNVALKGKAAEAAARILQKGDAISLKGSIGSRTVERDGISKTFHDVQGISFRVHARENTIAQSPPVKEASRRLSR